MRLVVIGGTGFIGSRVVGRIRDHDVVVVHRGCDDETHVHASRSELAGLGVQGDVVIDMMAMTERDAQTLVEAQIAPRMIVIGSADVYRQYDRFRRVAPGEPDPTPLLESAPLRETLFPYGGDYEKILVERVVMRQPGATILRLPAVYGPGDAQHRLRQWMQPQVTLQEAQAEWRWTRGYVENVADAIVLAAIRHEAAGRIYNVGEPDAPTEREWATLLGAVVDVAASVEGLPDYDWRCDLTTDTSAIRAELGYVEHVSRADAIRQAGRDELAGRSTRD
jgi:nucleoside-diphosphate-sugar epimerase